MGQTYDPPNPTTPDHTDLSELEDELWEVFEYNLGRSRSDKRDIETMAEVLALFKQYAQPPVVADEELEKAIEAELWSLNQEALKWSENQRLIRLPMKARVNKIADLFTSYHQQQLERAVCEALIKQRKQFSLELEDLSDWAYVNHPGHELEKAIKDFWRKNNNRIAELQSTKEGKSNE